MRIKTRRDIHETVRCWVRLMAVLESLSLDELNRAWWVADGLRRLIEEAIFTLEEEKAQEFREKMADD